LPTSVWAHGQAYKGENKTEDLLGNMMLSYTNTWGKHKLDVLGLAEVQKKILTGFTGRVVEICAQQGTNVRKGDVIGYILRSDIFA
jgi:biotin carboxyl carrier protein